MYIVRYIINAAKSYQQFNVTKQEKPRERGKENLLGREISFSVKWSAEERGATRGSTTIYWWKFEPVGFK